MKKLAVFACVVILTLTLLWLFKTQLLVGYAKLFTVDDATKGADAVVMLGGDPHVRSVKAVQLLKEGFAPLLLMTTPKEPNEKYKEIFPTQLEQMDKVLEKEGLKAIAVPSLKGGATSTFDEAYDLAAYSKKHGLKRLILVTGTAHTLRAKYAFEKVFALQGLANVKIQCAAAPNACIDESCWWQSEGGLTTYLLEPIKYLVYLTRSRNLTFIPEE